MPHHERPVTLMKDRLRQLREQFRPLFQRCRAERNHQRLRARRFGKRREHGGSDPRRRLRAGFIAPLVQRHAMPRARELPRDEPPDEPSADDGEIGRTCGLIDAIHNPMSPESMPRQCGHDGDESSGETGAA
jgi:hypothetical protein